MLVTLRRCLCAGVFALGAANAKDVAADSAQQNYRATQRYYAELTAGAKPRLAELNLLMTLLPKGGDLHHHYSGAIYAETYLDWAERQGACVYNGDVPAEGSERAHKKYEVEVRKPLKTELSSHCVVVKDTRADPAFARFYRELLMRWSDKDYANHSHQQLPPDEQFFATFPLFGAITGYATKEALHQLKERAKAENVQYIETMLRAPAPLDNPDLARPIDALPRNASEEATNQALAPFADFLAASEAEQKLVADFVKGIADDTAGLDDEDFTLRVQTYVSRNSPPSRVFSSLHAAFAAARNNPMIVGVNIVAPENWDVALRDYTLHMRMFRFLKQRFPSVRLSLHAGELALGMVPPEDLRNHIREAVEIAGAERIGHGVDMTHEDRPDLLIEMLRRRNVAIEVSLTSNAFILGVEGDAHPVTVYLRHRVPFVISTDDPGVSRNNLSSEYLLFASRYRPSYAVLKRTVYNSIRYSFLAPSDKARHLRQLDQRFATFEARVATMLRSK